MPREKLTMAQWKARAAAASPDAADQLRDDMTAQEVALWFGRWIDVLGLKIPARLLMQRYGIYRPGGRKDE